jgi:TPR repeat protein
MARQAFVARSFCLVFSILAASAYGQEEGVPQDKAAADARKQCDALASHPHDPARYAAGMPDELFDPSAAIQSCELAAKLNADVAREWFQLGRAYWGAQRYNEAFRAFTEAATRDYAPAMKFLGDAYLSGRGLPAGEHQDAQRAMAFYKKSAAGGFPDAEIAIQDVPGYIRKTTFDASAFQHSEYMAAIYNHTNISNVYSDAFKRYVFGLVNELASDRTLAIDSHCASLTKTALNLSNLRVIKDVVPEFKPNTGNSILGALQTLYVYGHRQQDYLAGLQEYGEGDAATMISRYGCQSEIAQKIVDNLVARFNPSPNVQRTALPGSPVAHAALEPGPGLLRGALVATVVPLQLNVRMDVNANSQIVGRLNQNQKVRIIRRFDNGWAEIQGVCETGANCTGFVNADYLQVVN